MATATETPGPVLGRWAIEGPIGRGGQATVYRARHATLGRPAALKLFHPHVWADPAFRVRFRRECDALVALEHPSIIPVYDAGEHDGRGYLVMRLARGGSLADRLAVGSLPAADALELLAQVADALDAAHRAGRLHRDVKPGNVLLEPGGHAWLADFGVARRVSAATPTGEGDLVGTVGYLAPEVIEGRAPTAASDRYAFAVMAFEALTGERPFPDAGVGPLLYAHVNHPPPRPSGVRPGLPPELDGVLAGALAKDPRRRPPSATDLVARLRRAMAGGGQAPTGAGWTRPLPVLRAGRRPSRRTLGIVVVAGALVAGSLGALGVVAARSGTQAPPAAAAPPPAPPPVQVPTPAGAVPGAPPEPGDLPGLPPGTRAAVASVGPVRVTAVPSAAGASASRVLVTVAAALQARGLALRSVPGPDGAAAGLVAGVPGDLVGRGPQWGLALARDGGREFALLVRGTAWSPATFVERMADARPGDLVPADAWAGG